MSESDKSKVLSELYTIRAGISAISKEKDSVSKAETNIKNVIDSETKAKQNIEDAKKNTEISKKSLESIKASEESLPSCLKPKREVGAMAYGGGVGAFLGFIVAVFAHLIMANLNKIGFKEGWGKFLLIGFFGGLAIGLLLGFIIERIQDIGYKITHKNEFKQRQKQLEDNKKKAQNDIYSNLKKVESEERQIVQLKERYLKEKENYKNVLAVSKSISTVIYNSLVSSFKGTLDPRDWENIDLIIFYYETGRADTIKEALQQVDRQRQTDSLIKAIADASSSICKTIQSSINSLRYEINYCFNSLSTQLDNQHREQMEKMSGLSLGIGELNSTIKTEISTKMENLKKEINLQNALIDKISTDSNKLMKDVDYILDYTKPNYIS